MGEHQQPLPRPHTQVNCGVCGTLLIVPQVVHVFQCGSCKTVLRRGESGETADQLPKLDPVSAALLEKKLLRDACLEELEKWLKGEVPLESSVLASKLLKTLQQFPLVNGEGEDVDAAVLKLVQSLPRMDARLQRTKGKNFLRKRMLNLLVSPAFYSSLGNTRFNVDAIPESSPYRVYEDLKHALTDLLSWMAGEKEVEWVFLQCSRLHSVTELDDRLARVVKLCQEALLQLVIHALAKPKSRFRSLYSVLPKRAIVRLVKTKTGISSASILPTLLFSKPLGAKCLMQRIAMAMLSVKELRSKVKSLKEKIPKPLVQCCEICVSRLSKDVRNEEALEADRLHEEFVEIIAHGGIKGFSLEDLAEIEQEHLTVMQECSNFSHALIGLREASAVAEVCGSEELARMFKTIFPVLHRSMFNAVSRTNEFVNFLQVMFGSWRIILQLDKQEGLTDEQRHEAYRRSICDTVEALFQVVKVLFNEEKASKKWRLTLYWVASLWKNSRIELDTEALLASLPGDLRSQLIKEAHILRNNVVLNAVRPPGSKKIRLPHLPTCNLVATKHKQQVLCQLDNVGADEVMLPAEREPGVQLYGEVDICVEFIEISSGSSGSTALYKGGFTNLGPNATMKRHGSEGWSLWIKRCSLSEAEMRLGSITELLVTSDLYTNDAGLMADGFVKVQRRIGRQGRGNVFLWYKREKVNLRGLKDIAVTVKDNSNETIYKEEALKQCGFLPLSHQDINDTYSDNDTANALCVKLWTQR